MAEDDKDLIVEITRSRWKTRRIMTWLTMIFFMFVVLLGFFYVKPADLGNFSTLYNIIAFFCTGVVGSYFGFATYDDVNSRKSKSVGARNRRKREEEEEPPCEEEQ